MLFSLWECREPLRDAADPTLLPEDFYLTNAYNILGDLVVETKLGLLGLWHVFGEKGERSASY